MSTQELINRLWNLCNVLRDDGVTYQEYINELTFLTFLKMMEETDQEDGRTEEERGKAESAEPLKIKKKEGKKLTAEERKQLDDIKSPNIPEGFKWTDLKAHNQAEMLDEYKKLLIHLGSNGSSITKAIFSNANTVIRKPKTLNKLVTEIDKLNWYDAKREGLGDMYEGLLEKNANEKKSGAGQYFTPRVLIDTMVKLMKPTIKDVVVDPTAGTGGFLISAYHQITKALKPEDMTERQYKKLTNGTFFGMELVSDTHRLAMMNLMLHGLSVDGENIGVLYGDTLSSEGTQLPLASLVLANPPFGTKMGGGVPTRDDLVHYTSNKQLAFLHLMYHKMLKSGGRVAVVLPDNVLFEGGIGKEIRQDLMDKCNLHTVLRLPTGIFYAAGVKTNVLFFSKPLDSKKDTGNTENVWVYDLRANTPQFGKRTPFTEKHLKEFCGAVGNDLTVVDQKARQQFIDDHATGSEVGDIDTCRLRCFTREDIRQKDDSLDLAWIRDADSEDAADLPEPDVLIGDAIGELTIAVKSLEAILKELGGTAR